MKTIRFHGDTNRSDDLLHIETDGCIVNIHVGLTDNEGRKVTAVTILPEDESRGGDGEGRIWHLVDGVRVVRQRRYLARISEPEPRKVSDEDTTRSFDTAAAAWSWLTDERREQEDASGDTGNRYDDDAPYSEFVDQLDGRATAAHGTSEWHIGSIQADTPGWDPNDGPDRGLTYSVESLD